MCEDDQRLRRHGAATKESRAKMAKNMAKSTRLHIYRVRDHRVRDSARNRTRVRGDHADLSNL